MGTGLNLKRVIPPPDWKSEGSNPPSEAVQEKPFKPATSVSACAGGADKNEKKR